MGYENVNLWFANNKTNQIVTIDDVKNDNRHNTYTCPVCGSEVVPSAVESVKITPHFKHIDKSRCSPESQIHWWYKNKFIMPGDRFKIVSDKEREYICKEIKVEQEYKVGDRLYRPDMTIITESGDTIYFEMNYTNKKKVEDYLDLWLELRNIVVEIDIKQLMQRNAIPTFTALFYNGKCFNTKKRDTYYNIIGKYKEKQYKNGINEKRKEQIKKLDWFWRDVVRYKKDEVDINYMIDEISTIENKDDKEIVQKILEGKTCNVLYSKLINAFEEELNIRITIIIDKIKNKLNNKYTDNALSQIIPYSNYESWYKYNAYIIIKGSQPKHDEILWININNFSFAILTRIEKALYKYQTYLENKNKELV